MRTMNLYQTTALITPNDVLCGRTKYCFQHEGNHRFRELIAEHAETYQNAPSKKLKMQVVQLIVDTVIARGGRFLEQSAYPGGLWIDGGAEKGKKKTGGAFRDALRGRVKSMSKLIGDNKKRQQQRERRDDTPEKQSDDASTICTQCSHFDEDEDDFEIDDTMDIEPSKDWMHDKMDSSTARDILSFLTDQ